ncbi:Beta-lactamase class penicillin binding protein [Mycena venus]|uniref:Beta-lactamase class penicillin binding protein n=1 Tax=Mycena venus TaxID=2733690 RepID=A0A8H7CX80_9AGAR|nr:Beta-lactamase class penicillin binding protein [Mycena venus]
MLRSGAVPTTIVMHLLSFALGSLPLLSSAVFNPGLGVDGRQQPLLLADDRDLNSILNERVEAAIYAILEDFNSPGGVGIAVVHKSKEAGSGWTVEANGYGVAKMDGTRVTSDTLFGIGSNSKLFDIIATGLLISNETLSPRISWDTKIASIVPEWALMDPVASSESTIVDVMSHRTGLPRHDFLQPSDTVPGIIRRLRYLKPSTGFRELAQYNNFMYTLLSYLPRLLVGIPFETYVNEYILEPLGMHSTTYYSKSAAESGHLADGIGRDGVNQTEDPFGVGQARAYPFWAPNEGTPGHVLSGPGGVISNAKDMAIWLQTLLEEGQHPTNNNTVIPSEVIRWVASGVTVYIPVAQFPELSPIVYGGGQRRGTYRGFEFIQARHGGSVLGFKSQVTRIPNQNLGVAVLSNDEAFRDQIVEAIKNRIIDEVLNLQPIDWSARYKSQIIANLNARPVPTRPENPTLPSVPFSALAGTYRDSGYGTVELCLVSPANLISSPTASCRRLVDEVPTRLPGVVDPDIPTFVAKWKGFGVTHVSLTHFEHNLFNVSGWLSVPTRNSSEKPYWVQPDIHSDSHTSFLAEFSFASEGRGTGRKSGIGLRGLWGASEADVVERPWGESVEERSEAWFEKIESGRAEAGSTGFVP